jgi:hypothetical protein
MLPGHLKIIRMLTKHEIYKHRPGNKRKVDKGLNHMYDLKG